MKLDVAVTYGQLCVFDPALDHPYNDWSEAHVGQGFSWRPGSVSFAVGDGAASVVVEVSHVSTPPDVAASASAIRVPFQVPASNQVEIGSVMSGAEVSVGAGSYALFYLAPQSSSQPFRLLFMAAAAVEPAVLKESAQAKMQAAYLMKATPA